MNLSPIVQSVNPGTDAAKCIVVVHCTHTTATISQRAKGGRNKKHTIRKLSMRAFI